MKRLVSLLILSALFFFMPLDAAAHDYDDDAVLNRQLDLLELGEIDAVILSSGYTEDFDFKEMLIKAAKGELDLSVSEITDVILRRLMSEIFLHGKLMRNLILICVFSAILRNLSSSFKEKGIGELGFFASYIVVVIILFDSFSVGVSLLQETVGFLVAIMQAVTPIVITTLAASGNTLQAASVNPMIFFAIASVSVVIKDFLSPILITAAVLEIVNYLTEREILTKFSELVKKFISCGLKTSAVLFVSALSLQNISAKGMNLAVNKTAKAAVNLIPVVGNTLSTAVDTVFYWSQALKSGLFITIVVLILIACFLPFMKLFAMVFVYKLTAAIIQPICDERITECIDAIGTFTSLMLGILATIIFMFTFSIMIILGISAI